MGEKKEQNFEGKMLKNKTTHQKPKKKQPTGKVRKAFSIWQKTGKAKMLMLLKALLDRNLKRI